MHCSGQQLEVLKHLYQALEHTYDYTIPWNHTTLPVDVSILLKGLQRSICNVQNTVSKPSFNSSRIEIDAMLVWLDLMPERHEINAPVLQDIFILSLLTRTRIYLYINPLGIHDSALFQNIDVSNL